MRDRLAMSMLNRIVFENISHYPWWMSEPDPMCYVLRDLRARAGLTQKQLSAELGIASRTILRWEAGEQTPNLTDLRRRLAARFGVSVAEMVGEAGPGAGRSR
jgi:DNA-binding XRE family transcriptional regulator